MEGSRWGCLIWRVLTSQWDYGDMVCTCMCAGCQRYALIISSVILLLFILFLIPFFYLQILCSMIHIVIGRFQQPRHGNMLETHVEGRRERLKLFI